MEKKSKKVRFTLKRKIPFRINQVIKEVDKILTESNPIIMKTSGFRMVLPKIKYLPKIRNLGNEDRAAGIIHGPKVT